MGVKALRSVDVAAAIDEALARRDALRRLHDGEAVIGWGWAELRGPGEELKLAVPFANFITDIGDEYYAKKGGAITVTTPTGMRLGTGVTAAAKNGAGAAIVTYNAGETAAKAIDGSFPTEATKGAGLGARLTWKTTWNAGESTRNALAEIVLTNESPLTDVAGTAANTIARALLSPTVNKGASDTLAVTWNHDFLGA